MNKNYIEMMSNRNFSKGELTIISGRPGCGKTAFLINEVKKQAGSGIATAIFSMEHTKTEIIGQESKHFEELSLFIDDTASLHISEMSKRIRKLVNEKNVEVVWIDYLQLICGNGETRDEEMKNILFELKQAARKLDIAIVAISQMGLNTAKELNLLKDYMSIFNLCNDFADTP